MKFGFVALIVLTANLFTFAQDGPVVPSQLDFADIRLRISESARREIQADVDALRRHPKYFQIKLDRVELYFPFIERIFREEGIPDDFKYLVIQESALISDAVSTSNAVGYWQFKKESAEEVGLRVDGTVDERINLISSTKGAAKYLKRNNFYFNNWLYSLQSYNQGRGGTERSVDKKEYGSKKMDIDKNTHWYVKKFLAHKIAFENDLKKSNNNQIKLVEYQDAANKSLKEIAHHFDINPDDVLQYNKWLKKSHVPDDKAYTVILPLPIGVADDVVAYRKASDKSEKKENILDYKDESQKYPVIQSYKSVKNKTGQLIKINGILGIKAENATSIDKLASAGGISPSKFRTYNDLGNNDNKITGTLYYLRAKKTKAKEHYHTVKVGENLWNISQKYGIKQNALMRKNRMRKPEELKPGRILWLRFIRPANHPIEYKKVEEPVRGTSVTKSTKLSAAQPQTNKAEDEIVYKEDQKATIKTPSKNIREGNTPKPVENNYSEVVVEKQNAIIIEEESVIVIPASKPSSVPSIVESQPESVRIEKPDYHIVQRGETLYGISRKYEITTHELAGINDISASDGIKPGQKLVIPRADSEKSFSKDIENDKDRQNSYITHLVSAGETLYNIARKYNVTIKDVMDWNSKNDYNVKAGEEILIKK